MTKLSKNQLEVLRLFIGMHLDGVCLNVRNTGLKPSNSIYTALKQLVKKGYITIQPRTDNRNKINYFLTFAK